MTDPYKTTSPEVLEQALELMDDIEAADFEEILQSVADNVVGTEPLSDTLLSDIPRTTPPRVGRTTSRSQRVGRPLGSIRSGIRPGNFIARKSPRNPIPLSPQVRIVNPQNTPSTGRSSRSGNGIRTGYCNLVKVVEFGQSGYNRAEWLYLVRSCCIRARWLYLGKSG